MTYEEAVGRAILDLSDSEDLVELCNRLGDVYPSVVRECVAQLAARGDLSAADAFRLTSYKPERATDEIELPVPHPLDADWRLVKSSRIDVTLRLQIAAKGGEILLLGVPSVFRPLLDRGNAVTLVDSNRRFAETLGRSRVVLGDISRLEPLNPTCAVIFADPPWYPEVIEQFLWFAGQSLSPTGLAFFSLPGPLTRPGIDAERSLLLEFASRCGLRLLRIESRALLYESPPFESASLAAAGLSRFPRVWRRGDLAIFERRLGDTQCRPAAQVKFRWIEHTIQGVDVRFRVRHASGIDPTPRPLGTSRVRLSVSARDPLIPLIDVWTSGNQIYASDSPQHLALIAASFHRRDHAADMIESDLRRKLTPHERILVARARNELERVIGSDVTRTDNRTSRAG